MSDEQERVYLFGYPNPETEPFWEAAKEEKFLVKRCNTCGKVHWYPRAICPFCASADTEWVPGAGTGRIYAYSHAVRAGVVIAYVELDEGPMALTNIVDCDPDEVCIGQEVRVVFKPAERGYAVPVFTPTGV